MPKKRLAGNRGTALVTGAAGFIGSFVAEEVMRLGYRVLAMDDLSGGFRENVPPGAAFIRGSINDEKLVQRIFRTHRIRTVYHLAAYAAEGLSHFIKKFNYENNLLGSVNLINASVNHGVECFVFTSSIAVYGPGQLPMRESMTPEPEDPYGIAKLAVEQELRATARLFGLPFVIFRPHNVYGERQNIGDRYRNVIGIFMNQILRGEPLSIFGDGGQTRAFTYIADVAPVIARSPLVRAARNEVFNIGADRAVSVRSLAREVMRAMGREDHPIRFFPARKEVLHAFSDHTKLARVFGKKKPVALRDGLDRMAAWALRHGSRESSVFKRIEIQKNLPSAWRSA